MKTMPSKDKIHKLHFMGISGSGMSGVASLARESGYEVTGCDLKAEGHSEKHLKGIDLLVVSPAVLYQNNDNPEYLTANEKGIALTWEKFLGEYLQRGKKVIAVSGTHGKSTITAMTGKVLTDTGFDPMVMVGAKFQEWGGNSRFGRGEYFVVEADEFNDNFLNYHPEIIILNNIEFDHPDYFAGEKYYFESFKKFIGNLQGEKILIANTQDEGVKKLISKLDLKGVHLIEYGKNFKESQVKLSIPGKFNQTNTLGVLELVKLLNIDQQKALKILSSFKGVGRRMELIGEVKSGKFQGLKIYDDYAHHPTAIKKTLSAFREKYPQNKLWVVSEPHGFSRTKSLLRLYKGVFEDANQVLIGPIFKARDQSNFGVGSKDIVKISKHKNIQVLETLEQIIAYLKKEIRGNDVLVVMGAGLSSEWAHQILQELSEFKFKDLTTFKIGGKIKYYFEAKEKAKIPEIVKLAKSKNLPIFVLGGGSDILVSDKDFNGVVIKYVGDKVTFIDNIVTSEAGVIWDDLVKMVVTRNLQGIECLSGIPGSVGAAPIQNIGAYGQELKETFVKLEAYSLEKEKFVTFDNKACDFGYRESIFKRKENWQKYIICEVTLRLRLNGKPNVSYESLKGFLKKENPSLSAVRKAVLAIRSSKLVNPNQVPNAGSFFKNPIVTSEVKDKLLHGFPDLKFFPFADKFKIPAGYLIEKAGWKGKSLGSVKVSDKHALVLTNPEGKGGFEDIQKLADKITNDVYKKFGIKLEPEVQYIEF